MDFTDKKMLIVYFSHNGENYSNGKIINLKTGNTAAAAEIINSITDADKFELVPVSEYPLVYKKCTEQAVKELKANSRPEYQGEIDISGYDTIILGYPNWCGTMPMIVYSFLEKHDFSGKTVLPLCTHEGSGMGRSESELKNVIPGADIRKGLAVHGSDVQNSENAIRNWLEGA